MLKATSTHCLIASGLLAPEAVSDPIAYDQHTLRPHVLVAIGELHSH